MRMAVLQRHAIVCRRVTDILARMPGDYSGTRKSTAFIAVTTNHFAATARLPPAQFCRHPGVVDIAAVTR